MFNDNPNQTGATPFPSRLSVSLNFAELQPELNLYVQATLNQDSKLLELATDALTKAIADKGALFLAVAHVVNTEIRSSSE